jgi:glycosyltransferase involved in cell wall biosynthesis
MDPPLISIIVATYNAGAQLQRCIDSVVGQTMGCAELIVIDGGSQDCTTDLIRRNRDFIAYWESNRDAGIADAWNKGLDHARGSWVLFLGADDALASPEVLSQVVPLLRENADQLLVFGRVLMEGGPWDGVLLGAPWQWTRFRRRMTIPHQAAFHHSRLFRTAGRFDRNLRIAADYELFLRLGERLSPTFIDITVSKMGGDGLSIRSPVATFRESRDAQIRIGAMHPVLAYGYFAYASARSVFRTRKRHIDKHP